MRIRPVCSSATLALALCLLALLPGTAWAQDPNTLAPTTSVSTSACPSVAPGVASPGHPEGSGTVRSSTWIAAHKFTLTNSTTNPPLTYAGNHFYNSPDSAEQAYYFAPLELEQGLLVDMYTCVFDDSSVANDLSFELQKTHIDLTAHDASWESLGGGSSSGSSGISFVNISLYASETIQNQVGNTYYHYTLRTGVSSDTRFAGCMVYWSRQISPAPATATFTDVPTSHWAFQQVEALKASGITQGCAPGAFCPENTLTRAEMAVFLARALGLNYPN